jgi:neopullulanase
MFTRILILITVIFSALGTLHGTDKIKLKRVEPDSWWIGMKNQAVQLLVYGENIAQSEPSINIPGVTLNGVTKVDNKNYLFINLMISGETKPGVYPIKFRGGNKTIESFNFTLLERRKDSSRRKGFDASDVIYLLMPDRFSNGNPSNDSVPGMQEGLKRSNPDGRHGGDIQGMINHLDYLHDLGATALWSTPLMEDNMERTSYHTYAITDYYRIDPRYGTNEDYRRLSGELHKRNMKLIMDVVTNHCGLNHWWMKDLPATDWVHQFDTFTRSNYQISSTYDPYASEYDKNLNFNGWFDHSMPDLNQNNPLLLTYFVQNTIWWIEYANLDGLRVDTYPYNDPVHMAEWTKMILEEYPALNIVGECWVHSPQAISYWQAGTKNVDGFRSSLPTVMDFVLHDGFLSALNEEDNWLGGLRKFYNVFTLDYVYTHPENMLVFVENHDTRRFNEVIGGDIRKFKMAYALLLTIRGIPQLYYGSEILMAGNKSKGDGDIRRDFPGGWPGDQRNAFTSEGRTPEENEAFNFLRNLLNWRKANSVIYSGKTMQYIPEENCYVYFRYNAEKTIMVILNNHETAVRRLDARRFAERMNGFRSGHEVISGRNLSDLSVIEVPPKSAMIIELIK